MWERWKKGETLHQIARLFDRPHTSIRQILAESGGIRPPQRSRSKLALTLAEREEISRSLVAGESVRAIAARLARAWTLLSGTAGQTASDRTFEVAAAGDPLSAADSADRCNTLLCESRRSVDAKKTSLLSATALNRLLTRVNQTFLRVEVTSGQLVQSSCEPRGTCCKAEAEE
jgi:hypothetical protein